MGDQRDTRSDVVDRIGSVASFLRRHPCSSLLVATQAIFFVAALGVLPDVVAAVLGIPTYPSYVLLVAIGGGTWWRGLALGLVATVMLDLIWSTLFLRRGSASSRQSGWGS